jgi:hypothetical protein
VNENESRGAAAVWLPMATRENFRAGLYFNEAVFGRGEIRETARQDE